MTTTTTTTDWRAEFQRRDDEWQALLEVAFGAEAGDARNECAPGEAPPGALPLPFLHRRMPTSPTKSRPTRH